MGELQKICQLTTLSRTIHNYKMNHSLNISKIHIDSKTQNDFSLEHQ